jgi:hypothetical protein
MRSVGEYEVVESEHASAWMAFSHIHVPSWFGRARFDHVKRWASGLWLVPNCASVGKQGGIEVACGVQLAYKGNNKESKGRLKARMNGVYV